MLTPRAGIVWGLDDEDADDPSASLRAGYDDE